MARVLIVEDDVAIRALLCAALGDEHDLLEAADGEEGLRLIREERPDLVLLDLGLPRLHGSHVLDTVKADPSLRDVPVIIVTAWGEEATARIARGRGAADVIPKPFEVADLRARVNAALGLG